MEIFRLGGTATHKVGGDRVNARLRNRDGTVRGTVAPKVGLRRRFGDRAERDRIIGTQELRPFNHDRRGGEHVQVYRDDTVAAVDVGQRVRKGSVCGVSDTIPDDAVASGGVNDDVMLGIKGDTHHSVVAAAELAVTMEGVVDGRVVGQICRRREEEGRVAGGRHPRAIHRRVYHINIFNRLNIRS